MVSVEELLTHQSQDPAAIEWISTRITKPIAIVEPDASWPARFATIAQLIRDALGERALSIAHVGSTSVPGLPAKDVIDIDLVVPDPTAEEQYVPALEAAGFRFILRERPWHEHRYFGLQEPYANLHVFGMDSPELVRHRLFRDWLIAHEEDRVKYAQVKREAAAASVEAGEAVDKYNQRKESVILEIYNRIFKAHGYLKA